MAMFKTAVIQNRFHAKPRYDAKVPVEVNSDDPKRQSVNELTDRHVSKHTHHERRNLIRTPQQFQVMLTVFLAKPISHASVPPPREAWPAKAPTMFFQVHVEKTILVWTG